MKRRIRIFKDQGEKRKIFQRKINRWIKKNEKGGKRIKIRNIQLTTTAHRGKYGTSRKDTILVDYQYS